MVMITHDPNIANMVLEPGDIGMGEFFVLQPNGAAFIVIGSIQLYAQLLTHACERFPLGHSLFTSK